MQTCRPAKCIEAIRVAKLDPCTLAPVPGLLNGYAIGCIIDPNWTPEIEEGEESIVKDNCGNICLRDDRCDLTKRWNLEFKIKDPDKEFLSLIEGNPLIVDGDGNSIGVRQLSYGACSPWLFLELFERTDSCDPDGEAIYLRHIFPAARLKWTGNEREGVFRILQIEGKTRDVLTDSIDEGPFGDIPVSALVGASTSERIDYAWFEDDFVPTIQCGAIEVPEPGIGDSDLLLFGQFNGDPAAYRSAHDGAPQTQLIPGRPSLSVDAVNIAPDRMSYIVFGDDGAGSGWFQYDRTGVLLDSGFASGGAGSLFIGVGNAGVSPDGLSVVYVTATGPNYEVERSTLAGVFTSVQQVVGETYSAPSWSPDGTKIAFAVDDGAGAQTIRITDLAGVVIAESSDLNALQGAIVWAPDSSEVYTVAQNAQAGGDREIVSIDAATGADATLIVLVDSFGSAVTEIDVLATGTHVVYIAPTSGTQKALFKVPVAGGAAIQIGTAQDSPNDATRYLATSQDGMLAAQKIESGGVTNNEVAIFATSVGVATAPIYSFTLPGSQAANSIQGCAWRSV